MKEFSSVSMLQVGEGIEVLMSLEEVNAIQKIAYNLKPKVAVEIGSCAGGSARLLVPHVEKLFCVDHWEDYTDEAGFDKPITIHYNKGAWDKTPEERFAKFCQNLKPFLFDKIYPLKGPSALWASVWTIPIDFLFIDGCHSYEAVKADIEAWTPHVREGGMILGHDYRTEPAGHEGFVWEFPGVAKAVHEHFSDVLIVPNTTFWMVLKGCVLEKA